MPSKVKRYTLKRIVERFKFALLGKAVCVYSYPEENRVEIMNWVGEGKKMFNTDIAYINPDLSYDFTDFVKDIPLGDESESNVVHETSADIQARFAVRQHTKYMIELALTCFPYTMKNGRGTDEY